MSIGLHLGLFMETHIVERSIDFASLFMATYIVERAIDFANLFNITPCHFDTSYKK